MLSSSTRVCCVSACCWFFALEAREAMYGLKHWLPSYTRVLSSCFLVCLLSFCTRTGAREAIVWLAREECVVFLPPALKIRLTGGSRRLLKYQCSIALILPNCICAGSKYTQKQNAIECHCLDSLALRPRKSESSLLKRSGKAALEAFTRKRPLA